MLVHVTCETMHVVLPIVCSRGTYRTLPALVNLATECVHRGGLDAPPGLHGQTPAQPPLPAESPRDAINDILWEFETMSVRLAELSLSLRDLLDRQLHAQRNEADGILGRRGLDVATASLPLLGVIEAEA